MLTPENLTVGILAGGQARRMAGKDKGLLTINGDAITWHQIQHLKRQGIEQILINANRHIEQYAAFGYPVIEDRIGGYSGPLAGMHSLMNTCEADASRYGEWLLTLPCDGPYLSPDYIQRFIAVMQQTTHDIVVAHDGKRLQPVYAAIRHHLHPSLAEYLAAQQFKIDRWYAQCGFATCDFSDHQDTFININSPEDLAAVSKSFIAPD